MVDRLIKDLTKKETARQSNTINLIASENFVSKDVLTALGSPLTNKYAEGYPSARYYGGNKYIDQIEKLCQDRALKLFGLSNKSWAVNVQSYSGSPANLAVYSALVPLGGKIMGLKLNMGGHLSHGYKASFTGKAWRAVPYGLDPVTERLDYDAISAIAKKEKPALIVAGYSAYSRKINFAKFRKIADEVGAYLMVDMSHFAGLVAGKVHPSPFPYADVVTTTTHKTMRGPRSALIFSNLNSKISRSSLEINIAKKIDSAVFPGLQGGPHINQIAAVAVALREASQSSLKKYACQVVKNAQALAETLAMDGWHIISGGTDTHLLLINTMSNDIGGKTASDKLEKQGIVVNKNAIPFDQRSPVDPSGIRLGTAALTTRGMKEREMRLIATWIGDILLRNKNVYSDVLKLCRKFPLEY